MAHGYLFDDDWERSSSPEETSIGPAMPYADSFNKKYPGMTMLEAAMKGCTASAHDSGSLLKIHMDEEEEEIALDYDFTGQAEYLSSCEQHVHDELKIALRKKMPKPYDPSDKTSQVQRGWRARAAERTYAIKRMFDTDMENHVIYYVKQLQERPQIARYASTTAYGKAGPNEEMLQLVGHVGIWNGALLVVFGSFDFLSCECPLSDIHNNKCYNRSHREPGHAYIFAAEGDNIDLRYPDPDAERNVLYDLGYFLDYFRIQRMLAAQSDEPPPLLLPLINPLRREHVGLAPLPSDEDAEQCHPDQLAVFNCLSHDIDLVQGPPGTGKSFCIAQIARVWASEGLVIIGAVQNRAIDILVQQLEKHYHKVKFVVAGSAFNPNMGTTARNYTLDCLAENNPAVVTCRRDLERANSVFDLDALRRADKALHKAIYKAKFALLNNARIVLTTAAELIMIVESRGIWSNLADRKVAALIMDESGLCPEYYGPLFAAMNPDRLVLFGDINQLPPFSQLFEEDTPISLMQRLQSSLESEGQFVPMLVTQFRMHPDLCKLVSDIFYSGLLRTDPVTMANRAEYYQGQHYLRGPYWLGYEREDDLKEEPVPFGGYYNDGEITLVLHELCSLLGLHCFDGFTVNVITFYKAQLERFFRRIFEFDTRNEYAGLREMIEAEQLKILTVDSAQGTEADFVFVSCVRSNEEGKLGFLTSPRSGPNRICVAMSRARLAMVVVGNSDILKRSSPLKKMLGHCSSDSARRLLRPGLAAARKSASDARQGEDQTAHDLFGGISPSFGSDVAAAASSVTVEQAIAQADYNAEFPALPQASRRRTSRSSSGRATYKEAEEDFM